MHAIISPVLLYFIPGVCLYQRHLFCQIHLRLPTVGPLSPVTPTLARAWWRSTTGHVAATEPIPSSGCDLETATRHSAGGGTINDETVPRSTLTLTPFSQLLHPISSQ